MSRALPPVLCVVLSGVGLALCRAEDRKVPRARTSEPRPATQRVETEKGKPAPKPAVVKKLTARQKRDKSGAKYQVFRLQKEVKKRFVCAECKGAGTKTVQVPEGGDGRILKPETIACPSCIGSGIAPAAGVHDSLSQYYQALFDYGRRYPEDAPLKTDLEDWIARAVQTDRAVMRLNADAAQRLAAGRGRPGDVYVVGVAAFAVEPASKAGPVVHAVLHRVVGASPRERVNLSVVFDGGIPPDLRVPCGVVLIAVDQGEDYYRGVFGNAIQTRVLSAIRARCMTANRLPWEPDSTGESMWGGDE